MAISKEDHSLRLSVGDIQSMNAITMDISGLEELYTSGNLPFAEYMDRKSYLEYRLSRIVMGD